MENEDLAMDALEDLGIRSGLTRHNLNEIMGEWSSYSQLLSQISKEIKIIAKLDEVITPLENDEKDTSSFFMEVSCLLTELHCPYKIITEGNLNSRFDTNEKRLLVLNFLLSELQGSQMQFLANRNSTNTHMEINFEESEQAKLLREILQSLEFSKPPDGIDISTLCRKIQERACNIQGKLKSNQVEIKPLFRGTLTENHWRELEKFNQELYGEYKLRREMLLKRLDVTIQSFQWSNNKSDKLRDRNQAIADLYGNSRTKLDSKPVVSLSELLAARSDLVFFEKTSSGSSRENTKSEVNKVIIGRVPDRGGRPSEAQPPPPEMPPWQQRQSGASGSVGWTQRGGRGGRGDSRGGGNWSYERGGNRGGYREAQGGGGGYHGAESQGSGYRDTQGRQQFGNNNANAFQQDTYNDRGRGSHSRGSYDDRGRPPRVQSGWYSNSRN